MDNCPRSRPILTINEAYLATMRASDLLRERQTYAAAFWLGGVERHKQVLGIGNTQAAVFNADDKTRFCDSPSHPNWLGAIRQRSIHCVRQ